VLPASNGPQESPAQHGSVTKPQDTHWFAVQTSEELPPPQSIVLPHPSGTLLPPASGPQLGVQPHTPGVPPPPHVTPVPLQLTQSAPATPVPHWPSLWETTAMQVAPEQQPAQLLVVHSQAPLIHANPVPHAVPSVKLTHVPVPASHDWQMGQAGLLAHGPQLTMVSQLLGICAHLPAQVWAIDAGTQPGVARFFRFLPPFFFWAARRWWCTAARR
jgi:hypothetical protein